MKVQHEVIDIKLPSESGVGYRIELDKLNNKKVNIRFFKGISYGRQEMFELERLIMLRVKIQFLGDLSKYIPIDGLAAKESIQSIDIDLDLIEVFFNRKLKKQQVQKLLSPIVDRYLGSNVGQYLSTIQMTYGEFTELVSFLQYLSYEPFKNEVKL
jgi:hypothetical protein